MEWKEMCGLCKIVEFLLLIPNQIVVMSNQSPTHMNPWKETKDNLGWDVPTTCETMNKFVVYMFGFFEIENDENINEWDREAKNQSVHDYHTKRWCSEPNLDSVQIYLKNMTSLLYCSKYTMF